MMKPLFLSTVAAAALWIPFDTLNAQIAGIYEPFTHQTNAQSWVIYDYADQQLYTPAWDSAGDGQNPDIFFTFEGSNSLEFFADEFSSNSAFVGNLATAGIDAIGCDVFIDDIDSFNYGEFVLFSTHTNRYYVSEIIQPATSGWDFAYASLTEDDWYIFENNEYVPIQLTPQILSEISTIGVRFHPLDAPEADAKAVGIDNFTFYADLTAPKISSSVSGGSFQLGFNRKAGIRYSIQSSPDLTNWTLVSGEGFITGSSPYTMTKPLTPGAQFFKVGIQDFLTPVAQVITP